MVGRLPGGGDGGAGGPSPQPSQVNAGARRRDLALGRSLDIFSSTQRTSSSASTPETVRHHEQLPPGEVPDGSDLASVVTQSTDASLDADVVDRIVNEWVASGGASVMAFDWGRSRALGDGPPALLLVPGTHKNDLVTELWAKFMPDDVVISRCLLHGRFECPRCKTAANGGLWILGLAIGSDHMGLHDVPFNLEPIFGRNGMELRAPY